MITKFKLFENNDNDDFIWIKHIYTNRYEILIRSTDEFFYRFNYYEGSYISYDIYCLAQLESFIGFNSLKNFNENFDILEIYYFIKDMISETSTSVERRAFEEFLDVLNENDIDKIIKINQFNI